MTGSENARKVTHSAHTRRALSSGSSALLTDRATDSLFLPPLVKVASRPVNASRALFFFFLLSALSIPNFQLSKSLREFEFAWLLEERKATSSSCSLALSIDQAAPFSSRFQLIAPLDLCGTLRVASSACSNQLCRFSAAASCSAVWVVTRSALSKFIFIHTPPSRQDTVESRIICKTVR